MNKKFLFMSLTIILVFLAIFFLVNFSENYIERFPQTKEEVVDFVERMEKSEKKIETEQYQSAELIEMYGREKDIAKKIAIIGQIKNISKKTTLVSNLKKLYEIECDKNKQADGPDVSLMIPHILPPLFLNEYYPGAFEFAKTELMKLIEKEESLLGANERLNGIFFTFIVMNSPEKDEKIDLLKKLSTVEDPVVSFSGLVSLNYLQNKPPEILKGEYNPREINRITIYFPRISDSLEDDVKKYFERAVEIITG